MIRFVDMRAADAPGNRFAFWNTSTDSFVPLCSYAWGSWAEFESEFEEVGSRLGQPLERFKGLCPPWVFEPVPEEGVCFRCLKEGHEPEECPRDAATVVQAVVRALRAKADWRQQHGDDPRALRNFADSIDPHSEEYDPNHDPLRPVATPPAGFSAALAEIRRRRMAAILGCDAAAIARLEELEPEAHREFGNRPLGVVVAGARPAVTLEEVQRWYRERGLLVSMKVMGDQMVYDFVGLIEVSKP